MAVKELNGPDTFGKFSAIRTGETNFLTSCLLFYELIPFYPLKGEFFSFRVDTFPDFCPGPISIMQILQSTLRSYEDSR